MATSPHQSLRVLFVDDEKPLQDFMRSELPRLGHEVIVCGEPGPLVDRIRALGLEHLAVPAARRPLAAGPHRQPAGPRLVAVLGVDARDHARVARVREEVEVDPL